MITQEEKKELINEITEAILVNMPDVLGKLMTQHAMKNKLKKNFFESNPDFIGHNELIAEILLKVEGENLSLSYEDILDKATPMIKERIGLIKNLNVETVADVKELDLKVAQSDMTNGAL